MGTKKYLEAFDSAFRSGKDLNKAYADLLVQSRKDILTPWGERECAVRIALIDPSQAAPLAVAAYMAAIKPKKASKKAPKSRKVAKTTAAVSPVAAKVARTEYTTNELVLMRCGYTHDGLVPQDDSKAFVGSTFTKTGNPVLTRPEQFDSAKYHDEQAKAHAEVKRQAEIAEAQRLAEATA